MSFLHKKLHKFMADQALKVGMKPIKNPINEEERLNEIKRLDLINTDVNNNRNFNNITQLACYLTGRTQSRVHILNDNNQICKNTHGFNAFEEVMGKDIPRSASICQYVLDAPREQLIINNVREDPRSKHFHEMPMAPNIQFYAGTPIITTRGYTVGTLCVMDKIPGSINHEQKEGLRLLSDQLSNLFEQQIITPDKLSNITPNDNHEKMIGTYYSSASILFTDFVGFTKLTENIEPGDLIETLDEFFASFDQIMINHGLQKVKTIGDSYMAVGGIPAGEKDHAKNTCKAGLDIIEAVRGINIKREALQQKPWEIRVGIHTGPIIAGTSGSGFDIWGDAVNIASRLESSGEVNRVNISGETQQFLTVKDTIESRGKIQLKNKGEMNTYFLNNISQ